MFLLMEQPYFPEKQKIVKKYKSGKVIAETVFQTLDTTNRNNRLYETSAVTEALKSDVMKERLEKRTFGGELDHPIPTEDKVFTPIRHTTLLFKEMSHIIPEIGVSGKVVEGVFETTSTHNGYTMAGLVSDGVIVGFSLRAVGDNVKRIGNVEYVQAPITMIAYDCVSFPSHKQAYLKEIKLQLEQGKINEYLQQYKLEGFCALLEHLSLTKGEKQLLYESANKTQTPKILLEMLKSVSYHIL